MEDAYYERHAPTDGRVLKIACVITGLWFMLAASAANAAIDLIKVPAMCGTAAEVLETLAVKMPNPQAIGKGDDGRGTDIATLFTGNGYWALLALMSPDECLCRGFGLQLDGNRPGTSEVLLTVKPPRALTPMSARGAIRT